MSELYPFTPKSNLKLKTGQYWPIRLEDGNYACGIVLDVPTGDGHDTRTFFAGLLNWTGANKPTNSDLEALDLRIIEQGKAHIKTITAKGEQIEGRIDLEKCQVEILPEVDRRMYSPGSHVLKGFAVLRKAIPHDHQQLKTQSTWGYDVINSKANKLLVKP